MSTIKTLIFLTVATVLILFSHVSHGAVFNSAIIGTVPVAHIYSGADTVYIDTDVTGDYSIGDEIRIKETSGDSLHTETFTIGAITSAKIDLDSPWDHPTMTDGLLLPVDKELVVLNDGKTFLIAVDDTLVAITGRLKVDGAIAGSDTLESWHSSLGTTVASVDSLGNIFAAGTVYVDQGVISGYSHVGSSRNTTSADYFIGVSSNDGAITITLDTDNVVAGRSFIIKDEDGNAASNNITIDTEASETIDGAASYSISTNYISISLYCDGTNWFIF